MSYVLGFLFLFCFLWTVLSGVWLAGRWWRRSR